MANIVITTTTNSVKFDLGVYSSVVGFSKATRRKESLNRICLYTNYVEYLTLENKSYIVHYTTNTEGALIVDSIDGVAPSSLSDLYDKLIALIA